MAEQDPSAVPIRRGRPSAMFPELSRPRQAGDREPTRSIRVRRDGSIMLSAKGWKLTLNDLIGGRRWTLERDGEEPCGVTVYAAEEIAGVTHVHAALALLTAAGMVRDWVEEKTEEKIAAAKAEAERFKAETVKDARAAYFVERHAAIRRWREESGSRANGETPACLSGVRGLRRMVDMPAIVYFLMREGQLVYVGQTTAPWPGRIQQHLEAGDKRFDDVWYVECDAKSVARIEYEYIQRFQPEYNRSGRR